MPLRISNKGHADADSQLVKVLPCALCAELATLSMLRRMDSAAAISGLPSSRWASCFARDVNGRANVSEPYERNSDSVRPGASKGLSLHVLSRFRS